MKNSRVNQQNSSDNDICAKCCFTPKSEFSRSLEHLKMTLNFSEKTIGGCLATPKSEFSRSLEHLKMTLNFSEKTIGGCLVTSSKLFRTRASVIRNKRNIYKLVVPSAVLLKNSNFQG